MVCDKSIPFLISINMGISTLSSYIENSWSAFWIWCWITQTRSWLSPNFVVPYFYKQIGHEIPPVHKANWVLLLYTYVLVLIWLVGLDLCIWAMFHPKEIQIWGLKLAVLPPRERALPQLIGYPVSGAIPLKTACSPSIYLVRESIPISVWVTKFLCATQVFCPQYLIRFNQTEADTKTVGLFYNFYVIIKLRNVLCTVSDCSGH